MRRVFLGLRFLVFCWAGIYTLQLCGTLLGGGCGYASGPKTPYLLGTLVLRPLGGFFPEVTFLLLTCHALASYEDASGTPWLILSRA